MARPGDTLSRTITREDAATGAGVSGLVTADFAVTAFRNGVSFVITATVTSLGSGKYKFTYTLPSQAGIVDIFIVAASGTDVIWPGMFSEEVEAHDLDSMAAINRPGAILAATSGIGQDFALRLIKGTYDEIEVTIYEADGVTPVDGSTWDNLTFGIKNNDQSIEGLYLPYLQNTGITFSADGLLQILVPETASFYAALLAANLPSRTLFYSVLGDQGADDAKTRCILRGQVTISRQENEV